ncbi:hypothetical protein SANA_26410 [Gottschalkiaceae bacterium SANA]|nr:hypothetical protein SANA_26410 [Gottschalkiaceae bacterium SANA]
MKRILFLTSIMIMCFLVGACAPAMENTSKVKNASNLEKKNTEAAKIESMDPQGDSSIQGLFLPHHELARELIESAWEEALEVEPDLIILIGPDHPGLADYPLIWTSETESQLAVTCSTISKDWIKEGLGGEAIIADHSIETPLKILLEMGTEIPVLAITLPRGMEAICMDRIVEAILEIAGNDLLLVGSVDFSHGLISQESKKKDETSFQWIRERNMDAIQSAGNAYFDSPETIQVLLRCLAGDVVLIERSDSSDFGCGKELPGTSYQVMRLNQ